MIYEKESCLKPTPRPPRKTEKKKADTIVMDPFYSPQTQFFRENDSAPKRRKAALTSFPLGIFVYNK